MNSSRLTRLLPDDRPHLQQSPEPATPHGCLHEVPSGEQSGDVAHTRAVEETLHGGLHRSTPRQTPTALSDEEGTVSAGSGRLQGSCLSVFSEDESRKASVC